MRAERHSGVGVVCTSAVTVGRNGTFPKRRQVNFACRASRKFVKRQYLNCTASNSGRCRGPVTDHVVCVRHALSLKRDHNSFVGAIGILTSRNREAGRVNVVFSKALLNLLKVDALTKYLREARPSTNNFVESIGVDSRQVAGAKFGDATAEREIARRRRVSQHDVVAGVDEFADFRSLCLIDWDQSEFAARDRNSDRGGRIDCKIWW